MTGNISPARSAEPVSMRVASADRAAAARMGRASMRREHTTSLARCEGARGSPGAHPGQTCSAHRLAATSRSLVTGGDTAVPFARAVVIVRRRKLDGVMETVGLHDPVKTAPSSDRMRARQRYRGDSRYVAAAFIGAFFPPTPLLVPCSLSHRTHAGMLFVWWL